LGFATAEALVTEGANVVVCGRNPSDIDAAVTRLSVPGRAIGVEADVADPGAADRLIDAATSTFGQLDGAVLSVGGPPGGSVRTATPDQWRGAFETTFLGPLQIAVRVGEVAAPGGAIAFVLSSSVRSPLANLAISNGLRPGLAMAAKTLADELGPRGIRVFGLLPGRIETDRTRELDQGDPLRRPAAEAAIPLRRYGQPHEFGSVAAFLISPRASYVNGVMVPVDGGALRSL
jgi:3-oxoacyl-[acyl-carrier protein] reductase